MILDNIHRTAFGEGGLTDEAEIRVESVLDQHPVDRLGEQACRDLRQIF